MSVPPQEETGGFTLIVTVTIQPDKYDEWLRHSWTAFKHVTAEPDCLSFEMFTVPGDANKVKWVESWSKSLESVMAVRISPCISRSPQAQPGPTSSSPIETRGRFLSLIEVETEAASR